MYENYYTIFIIFNNYFLVNLKFHYNIKHTNNSNLLKYDKYSRR